MRQKGLTLIELMIGLLMTSILALSVMSLMATNTRVLIQQDGQSAASADAQQLHRIIAELVKQAEICATCAPSKTLDIVYAIAGNPNAAGLLSQANDDIRIDLMLPVGYKIWPNNAAPYDNPAIRLEWGNNTGIMTVQRAASKGALDIAPKETLLSVSQRSSRAVNIDLWPLAADGLRQAAATDLPLGGYELCVAMRAPMPDYGYSNPEDSGDLLHYRTAKICGTIFPRNW